MTAYSPPLDDARFLLQEVFNAPFRWAQMPRTQALGMEDAMAVLEAGGAVCAGLVAPTNAAGDRAGCRLVKGAVQSPPGFPDAWATYAAGGWIGLGGDPAWGGQGLPQSVAVLFQEMLFAANPSFALYSVLTSGVSVALAAHASGALRARYLPALYSGRWAGTMCLTVAQAGTDLGLLRCQARPDGGRHRIQGEKIFITGGDHDLTENILHLVLARLPDAPPGNRGLSLFAVPRRRVNHDGSLGDDNGVRVDRIEEKMGIHGSPTCVLQFEDSLGDLVGEPHQGLAAMFTMMNYERLSIGLQGLGLAEAAYQSARAYARDRVQGRAASGSSTGPDPILVHGDVRHMLLTQKASTQAGRALAVWTAEQLDLAHHHPDPAERGRAEALVALLTPVAKASLSDWGFANTVRAQQVFGGHGYTRAWDLEQRVRDARIAQIYEGTNGVQAMDLVGRKLVRDGGQLFAVYCAELESALQMPPAPAVRPFHNALQESLERLRRVTDLLLADAPGAPELAGAVATDYLALFALTTYSYLWLRMASASASGETPLHREKLATGRFFVDRVLPQGLGLAASIVAGAGAVAEFPDDAF